MDLATRYLSRSGRLRRQEFSAALVSIENNPPEYFVELFVLVGNDLGGAVSHPSSHGHPLDVSIRAVSRESVSAVSYTHLTLPTIYSV